MEKHYRVRQVAELLNVTERTVRQWVADGKLTAARVGRAVLIPESALRSLIAR